MATLKAEFLIRYSDARVRQLTNPDKVAPTAVDDDRLDAAVADAIGDFSTLVQVEYIETDAQHIRIGVLLVEAILMEYGTATGSAAEGIRKKASEEASRLKLVTGRGRASVQTTLIESQYKFPRMLPSEGRVGPDGRRLFGGT